MTNINLENLKKLKVEDKKKINVKHKGEQLEFEIVKVPISLIERYNSNINPIKTTMSLKLFNKHRREIDRLRNGDDEVLQDYMITNGILSKIEDDNDIEELINIRKELIHTATGISIGDIDKFFNSELLRDLSNEIYDFSK